LIFHRE